jgi:hypothetical protein
MKIRPRVPRSRAGGAVATLLVLAALTGCFNPFRPLIGGQSGISVPPPVPNSAQNVLRLLEWCYNNRAIEEYREIFADDYRFVYSALDSNGQAYRDVPWTREDELISTGKLFLGGDATQPAATSISLAFDRNFNVTADTRPGKNPIWHKNIRTQVVLNIRTSDGGAIDVTGFANFFLVRGDSAQIPAELPFGPDPNRWYIERWEDQTAQGNALAPPPPVSARGRASADAPNAAPAQVPIATRESVAPAAATPSLETTFGYVKRLFRRL